MSKDLEYGKIRATRIDEFVIEKIRVDLLHINFGLDGLNGYKQKRRSSFTFSDIVLVFESLIEIAADEMIVIRKEDCRYYVLSRSFFMTKKKFRFVFCVHDVRPDTAEVITFFRSK
jgi:hypothetical protein